MKIKKGNTFVCIKKVHIKNERCFYLKGRLYYSEIDDCITDEQNTKDHKWSIKKLHKKYWLKIK